MTIPTPKDDLQAKGMKSVWAKYTFNEEYWDKLIIYWKLPWYKRLFKRTPKP